jgi:hypothetical protein
MTVIYTELQMVLNMDDPKITGKAVTNVPLFCETINVLSDYFSSV